MSQRETQLPDLDTLGVQSLKALVLAKQAEIDSHTTEIESLKLLIVKLRPPVAEEALERIGQLLQH